MTRVIVILTELYHLLVICSSPARHLLVTRPMATSFHLAMPRHQQLAFLHYSRACQNASLPLGRRCEEAGIFSPWAQPRAICSVRLLQPTQSSETLASRSSTLSRSFYTRHPVVPGILSPIE